MIFKLVKAPFIRKNLSKQVSLYAFIVGAFSGASYVDFTKSRWYSQDSGLKSLNVCFTPPSGCAELIAKEISHAKKELHIQAYGFTSQKIIDQIIKAYKKGVKVHVIVDKSNLTDRYSKMHLLLEAGIKVKIDKLPGIAHNKVMIIDSTKVITGSFNFTNQADKKNAENVILIKDENLAAIYIDNWYKRYSAN